MVIALVTSLIPEDALMTMAESTITPEVKRTSLNRPLLRVIVMKKVTRMNQIPMCENRRVSRSVWEKWIGVVARNVYHCHVELSASAVEKWTACMSNWWSGMTSVALPITTNFLSFVLIKTSCIQHW